MALEQGCGVALDRWGVRCALALAVVVLADLTMASAQPARCGNPAGYCSQDLDSACLSFGAGARDVPPVRPRECEAQFEGYRVCIAGVARDCPVEELPGPSTPPSRHASQCGAEAAQAEWNVLRDSKSVGMLQAFSDFCAGTLQSELAKARIADLVSPPQPENLPRKIDPTGYWTFTRNGRHTIHLVKLLKGERLQVANQTYVWVSGEVWKDEDATGTYEFFDTRTAVWRSNDARGLEIRLQRLIDPGGVWGFTHKGTRRQNVFGLIDNNRLRVNEQIYVHVGGNVWKDKDGTGTYDFTSDTQAVWRSNRSGNLTIKLRREQ